MQLHFCFVLFQNVECWCWSKIKYCMKCKVMQFIFALPFNVKYCAQDCLVLPTSLLRLVLNISLFQIINDHLYSSALNFSHVLISLSANILRHWIFLKLILGITGKDFHHSVMFVLQKLILILKDVTVLLLFVH